MSVETVQAWQNAANTQDKGRLLELSDPNIEIVGPRGSGSSPRQSVFSLKATPWFWLSTAYGVRLRES